MATISGIDHKYIAIPMVAMSLGLSAYAAYRLHRSAHVVSESDSDVYESTKYLSEYLVFHYGTPEEVIPYPFGPKDAIDFPKRCAELCLKHMQPKEGIYTRALDIGCSVGRSTFELARVVNEVIGIDYSQSFIDAAKSLCLNGQMPYSLVQEGDIFSQAVAKVPKDIDRTRVTFEQGDACALRSSLGAFDLLLASNVLCRLHHPKHFLSRLQQLLPKPDSILVLIGPYVWLDQFTDKSLWLGGYIDANGEAVTGFKGLLKELGPHFELVEQMEMPFLIRETARQYQWTVSHATVWRRR
ncbi:type 11 methyltransferase [Plakobranchus ocellatus]|uniref:Type 11 methyltransferase n=1 Tax=Plakobranchus ocellatus TaxID=259542 RepID=A0AAV4D198_9GAST|nr:type 11 methyltransferase [Plakobranchus ocellatus]